MTVYAVVRAGGKQYRVEPDQIIDVERLPAEVGATVELNDVLLVARNGDVRIGQPRVEGARVVAEVLEHGRDRKIIVFKYKAKTRYRRKRGHRQPYTRLAIRQILIGDEPAEPEAKPRRARRRRAEEPAAEAPAAEEAAAQAEAPPEARPRRARRRTTAETPTAEAPEEAAAQAEAPAAEEPAAEAEAEAASTGEAKGPAPEEERPAEGEAPPEPETEKAEE